MDEQKNSSEKEELPFIPKSDEKIPSSLKFGWGKFRPKCLQIVNGPKCFLSVVVVFTACQAMVIMGLTSITVPSIEKRFSLTSKELGVILASNDVTALIVVIFIGYYGDYWNKIRLIGGGGVILSFSVLLYALPHFIIGPYQPSLTGSRGPTCFSGNVTGPAPCSQESDSRWYYMGIFVLAQLIMGAGIAPFYSLLPAYLDENVHPKQMPVYLGIWSFANFLGPGVGMIIGGKFLSIYVDLDENVHPKQMPVYLGIWSFANFLGPGMGMLVGGKFLSIYVDLDENVHPKDMPVYLGVWSFANFVSPGIGMLIGGAFLSIYVDLDENVHPKDMPVYLGVWSFANYVSPGIGMVIGGAFLSIYVDL